MNGTEEGIQSPMNLQRLFRRLGNPGWRNPTTGFAAPVSPPAFAYDVVLATLNGITYGSPVEALAPLGPASEARRLDSGLDLQYDHLGLGVTLDAAGVDSYEMAFSSRWLALGPVDPCAGITIRLAHRKAVVARDTSADQLDALLGAPYDRFRFDDGELGSLYATEGSHFIATHSADDRLLLHLDISEAEQVNADRTGRRKD